MPEQPYHGKSIRVADWMPEVDLIVESSTAHASAELLANPVELKFAVKEDGVSFVQGATAIDYDDQGANLDLLFFGENPGSLGTLNAAMAITDAQARMIQGNLAISAWLDVGAQQVGSPSTAKSIPVRSTNGDMSIWVAARSAGTGTYPTGLITVKIGFLRG